MLSLILTVLSRGYSTPPPILIPTKDCEHYKGEHPHMQLLQEAVNLLIEGCTFSKKKPGRSFAPKLYHPTLGGPSKLSDETSENLGVLKKNLVCGLGFAGLGWRV